MKLVLRHPIAMPKDFRTLRAVKYGQLLCLRDAFNLYSGAIFTAPQLASISENFEYNSQGYDQLRGQGRPERFITAEFDRMKSEGLRQVIYDRRSGKLDIGSLDSDLRPFETGWCNLFDKFAREMQPVMGNNFEVRLKLLQREYERFHLDYGIVGLLPLGKNRLSTVCRDIDGSIIRPTKGEMVITTPSLAHSSPVSLAPRIALGVTKALRHF